MIYEISGYIGNELVSRHYSSDIEYVDIVSEIEWFKSTNGYCIDLEVKKVDKEGKKINTYVGWVEAIVKYYRATGYIERVCKDIPEFY